MRNWSTACLASCLALVAAGFPPLAAAAQKPGPQTQAPAALDSAAEELQFSPVGEQLWRALNEDNGIVGLVHREGFSIGRSSATDPGHGWSIGVRTTAFGRVGELHPIASSTVVARRNRAEFDHGLLLEWLINEPRGIEQGWTIHAPPEGSAPLAIELSVSGSDSIVVSEDGRTARFIDAAGSTMLDYVGLAAWDAHGIDLEACLVASDGRLEVRVIDTQATYPVMVDPVFQTPAWSLESNTVNARLGYRLDAGDFNGDGHPDALVTARPIVGGSEILEFLFVYYGNGTDFDSVPGWTLAGQGTFAGDVDGDGFDDVLVGDTSYDNGAGDKGRAFLYRGSASGVENSASWSVPAGEPSILFPTAMSAAGDVDGDGFDDVILGSTGSTNARVYRGSAAGLLTGIAWSYTSSTPNSVTSRVRGIGDVNGDGFDDVAVALNISYPPFGPFDNFGRADIFHGSVTGLDLTPAQSLTGGTSASNFGQAIDTAGDVNGDGFEDLIIGASWNTNAQTEEGSAFVYHGSMSGLAAAPAWTVDGGQSSANLGATVASAGDVNCDGYADVIVGAPLHQSVPSNFGTVFLYEGGASGLGATPAWSEFDNQPSSSLGWGVAGPGDVNGDGCSDLLLTAYSYTNGEANEGWVGLYLGAPDGTAIPYCTAGTSASGCTALLSGAGIASASAPAGFVLESTGVEGAKDGLIFFGANGRQGQPWGNGSSLRCVVPPVRRAGLIAGTGTAGLCDGNSSTDLNALWCPGCPKATLNPGAGAVAQAQFWYRDPQSTSNQTSSLSDAVEFILTP